jgi:hypothetical protein
VLNNESGPRYWSPRGGFSGASGRAVPRGRTGEGILSLVTGVIALALGLLPLFGSHITLLFSTVGITAIATGIVTLTRWRWAGFGTRLMSALGVAFGAVGIVLMLGSVVHAGLVSAAPPAQPAVGLPGAGSTPSEPARPSTGETPPAAGLSATQAQVAQSAGTLVFLLRHSHDLTGGYPDSLPSTPGAFISTAAGPIQLPPNVRIDYFSHDDGSGYQLFGSTVDNSIAVEYDTETGVLEWVRG